MALRVCTRVYARVLVPPNFCNYHTSRVNPRVLVLVPPNFCIYHTYTYHTLNKNFPHIATHTGRGREKLTPVPAPPLAGQGIHKPITYLHFGHKLILNLVYSRVIIWVFQIILFIHECFRRNFCWHSTFEACSCKRKIWEREGIRIIRVLGKVFFVCSADFLENVQILWNTLEDFGVLLL